MTSIDNASRGGNNVVDYITFHMLRAFALSRQQGHLHPNRSYAALATEAAALQEIALAGEKARLNGGKGTALRAAALEEDLNHLQAVWNRVTANLEKQVRVERRRLPARIIRRDELTFGND